MGPYYLTALDHAPRPGAARDRLGADNISGTDDPQPAAGRRANRGRVPTHLAAVLDFASGPIATLVTSFDVWASEVPSSRSTARREVSACPIPTPSADRCAFAGRATKLARYSGARPYTQNSRGLGLADMAAALRGGRLTRASGELAYHVLDVMHAVETASREGRHVEIASTCDRPAPLNEDDRVIG